MQTTILKKEPPKVRRELFWDTNMSNIDWKKNARDVIARTMMRGNIQDWIAIRDYYGLEKIKEEVLKVRYFDEKTLFFLSTFFNIPKEKFRCYS